VTCFIFLFQAAIYEVGYAVAFHAIDIGLTDSSILWRWRPLELFAIECEAYRPWIGEDWFIVDWVLDVVASFL
jgi:hypothetical protein